MNLENLPQWAQDLIQWLINGGAVIILTWIFTTFRNKAKKQKYQLEAKDEQIEALISSIIELKGMVYSLSEIVALLASSFKTIPAEPKEKIAAIIETMRKKYRAKLDQTVFDIIEEAKQKSAEAKAVAATKIEETKIDAQMAIDKAGELLHGLVSEEIKKNSN